MKVKQKRLESVSLKQSTRKRRGAKGVEAWALIAAPFENYATLAVWPTRRMLASYQRSERSSQRVREAVMCRITYTLTPITRKRSKED